MIDRLSWASIVLFTVLIIFSTALVQIMVGVLAILFCTRAVATGTLAFKTTPLDLPFLGFLFARVLSTLLSTNLSTSLPSLYLEIVFYGVFFLITQQVDITNQQRVQLLFRGLFAAAILASLIGIAKYTLGLAPRAESTTSGYYTLGNYLTVVLAIVLFLGRTKEFFPDRRVWVVVCLVISVGILLTFNRLHWVAMFLLYLYVGFTSERKLLAAFAVGVALLFVFSENLLSRFSDLLNIASHTSGRDVLWKGAWLIADQHPFLGFGPRTFNEIFVLRDQLADKGVGSWHNDYLQVYMESGLLGLGTLLWLIVSPFYFGVKCLRSGQLPDHLRQLLKGLLASIAVMAVVGGVLDILVSLLFRLILAVIAVTVTDYPLQQSDTTLSTRS